MTTVSAHRAARIHVVTALNTIIAVTIQVALVPASTLAQLPRPTATGVAAGEGEQDGSGERPTTETTKHICHVEGTLNCTSLP